MKSELRDTVHYYLSLGADEIHMNDLIGAEIRMEFLGEIHCIRCGKKTGKSFAQGYCYPCYISAPETSECVLRPELCQAHEGISRDMEWSKDHCLQEHIVYLALSSGLKVGVTRSSEVPVRWIDQGAFKAIQLARTPNRYIAGMIEVSLKEHFNDKTNWRRMLTNSLDMTTGLLYEKSRATDLLPQELEKFVIPDNEITEISYPVMDYPEKVKSVGLDKSPVIEGKLSGIKGQYLIFSGGNVINIRKHSGYILALSY